jgi:prepilin-type N-terminal cleavage/methylation domain-containing protein
MCQIVREGSEDAGFTLVETMVTMAVMTIVMSIFTTSMVQMYSTANNVEAKSITQTQVSTAMQRLDRQIRYAKGISQPYTIGGIVYVDMLAVQQTKRQCIQLRVTNGVLSQRTWTYLENPLDLSGWTPVASGLTSAAPFGYLPPTDALGYQQLTVALAGGTGSGADANTVTFTALNSDRTTGQDYCSAARGL